MRIVFRSVLLQPPEIAPAALEAAVVAVLDEFLQSAERVVFALRVRVVLYAVDLDAAVVLGEGLIMRPGFGIGLDGVKDPVFKNEARRVEVGCGGQAGGRHFAQSDEAAAPRYVLLAPVASLAARREVLDGFPVVDAFLGAVDPSEAQRHLHGIDIPHHAGAGRIRPVDAQPEIRGPVVIFQEPLVQLLAGMYVEQVGDFHIADKFTIFRNFASVINLHSGWDLSAKTT